VKGSTIVSALTVPEPVTLDDAAMRVFLLRCVEHVGGHQARARRLKVSQREMSLAVNGHRTVSARVAAALGFYRYGQPRRVVYQKIR
jgi:hypothetical protein